LIQQLRTCEIFEGNKAAFHAHFRDRPLRIMRTYALDFVGVWESVI
jgi:hypothetical protein